MSLESLEIFYKLSSENQPFQCSRLKMLNFSDVELLVYHSTGDIDDFEPMTSTSYFENSRSQNWLGSLIQHFERRSSRYGRSILSIPEEKIAREKSKNVFGKNDFFKISDFDFCPQDHLGFGDLGF